MSAGENALVDQAIRVEELATQLLANPDWEQTQLHFESPFGPAHRLDLLARASSQSLGTNDFRDARILRNNAEGIQLAGFMMTLNKESIEKYRGKYPGKDDAAALLEEGRNANLEVLEFVTSALRLHLHGYDQGIMDQATLGYASLLTKGSANRRYGIKHTLPDHTKVLSLISERDGEPWKKIDTEAEVQVRAATNERTVDFRRYRDGRLEIVETGLHTAQAIRPVVGESRILQWGEGVVEVDLGDNAAKKAVVEEMEQVIGLRALDGEQLNFIEEALRKTAETRLR